MKKIVCVLLVVGMICNLTACGNKTKNENTGNKAESQTETETNAETESTEESAAEAGSETSGSGRADETVGEILRQDFMTRVNENENISDQELAEAIVTNQIILFQGTTMEVAEGNLTGFTKEVNGFESGTAFMPTIGSIPFIGYIFTLKEGADVNTFMSSLSEIADKRWNICTEADQVVIDSAGDKVFFLMCPEKFEE